MKRKNLILLVYMSLFGISDVLAQNWGPSQELCSWFGDPATQGTGTHLSSTNYATYNTALATSGSGMNAGSGVTLQVMASTDETYTFYRLAKPSVDGCSPAAAIANNDYMSAQVTLRSDIRALRVDGAWVNAFTGNGVVGNPFSFSFSILDITAGGVQVFAFQGVDAVPPGGGSIQYSGNSSTAGWNYVILKPGHTYEFRWYVNRRASECGTANSKNIDNPGLTVQQVDAVTVSGKVYNDYDGTGNGISNLSGAQVSGLNALLVDAAGKIVAVTSVNAASGAYSFAGIDPLSSNSFKVMLTTATLSAGQTAAAAASLPAGWLFTGENNGIGVGNDGLANGISAVFTPTGNMADVNFGINQPPVATNDNLNGATSGSPATVSNILGNDTDPGGGALSAGNITLVAPSGATGIITDAQGDVIGFTVPGQGNWSLNSNTGAVTFTPQNGFTSDPTPISYSVDDAAGAVSNNATITIDYNAPVTVSGTVRNDNNGMSNGVDGNAYASATVTLYAANGTTVLATTTTDASGNYSFANQVPGDYVVGITPPAGYNNVSAIDATPTDGKTSVTVGSSNISDINFGINQPPAATNDNLANQAAGSSATIGNILANDSDPNGGTLSKDSISLVAPVGATGIVTDGQGDVTDFTVSGQGTWSLNSTTGAVTFTPQTGFTGDPTPVTYTVTDNAGLTSNPAMITIDYNPVPDLTPIILLPVNALNADDSRDFVVRLNEIRNVSTSGQIALNISVPAGYTLSFQGSATSISVLLAGTFTISNSQWNTFNVSGGSIDLQSKPGFSVTANGNIYIGFRIKRVSVLPSSVGNISVNIYPDNTKRYDSDNANNLYHRVITGN